MDETGNSLNGDDMENLKGVRISSMDDDEEDCAEEQRDDYEIEDHDEDDDEYDEPVTLGFVERAENPWSLHRQCFPSKAGGVPAWLDPVNIPSGKSSSCDICGEPLQFLLQIYAPPITEKDSAFHRTVLVFMCQSMTCLLRDQHEQWKRSPEKASRSVKVFRCQLPRLNPFYPYESPRHDGTDKPSGNGSALCNWCGTWKGDKVCSHCKQARYCSEKHQGLHWHSGHKNDCQLRSISSLSSGPSSSGAMPKAASKSLWAEYKMIEEDESAYDEETLENSSSANSLVSSSRTDGSMMSLLDSFEGSDERKAWASFEMRIAKAPKQVLRYCRGITPKPLWPMSSGHPSKADIPRCRYCGGPSGFEFQILPQLLYFFGVKNDPDSLDWATIVVYSCESSCDAGFAYKEEFAWVQLPSPSQVILQ